MRDSAAFGLRLGRFTQVGKRSSYPLALTQADAHTAERLAVIGNAAQGLHPIAGQGFNLGLRDAACLAEVLADAQRERPDQFDPGSADVLQRYAEWRREDRGGIVITMLGAVVAQPLGQLSIRMRHAVVRLVSACEDLRAFRWDRPARYRG